MAGCAADLLPGRPRLYRPRLVGQLGVVHLQRQPYGATLLVRNIGLRTTTWAALPNPQQRPGIDVGRRATAPTRRGQVLADHVGTHGGALDRPPQKPTKLSAVGCSLPVHREEGDIVMRHLNLFFAALALTTAAGFCGLAGVAQADPPPGPICGTPDVPCAGPSPLTPQQQCALTAWRTMMPCNWLGQQVPQGTPGSWG